MSKTDNNQQSARLAIVGAGPVGIELSVSLQRAGFTDTLHFEAGQIGQTFTWWPPFTPFFSTPERIAIAGIPIPTLDQQRISGEQYLAYLRMVVEQFDLPIHTYEPVERVEPLAAGKFRIHTRHHRLGERTYHADEVILASGGMASPNRLGIPGEDLPHVSHYFGNPHQYFRQRLLIVGGRNSAAEAALRCWRIGAQVAISYRQPEINESVKVVLGQELNHLIEIGRVAFYPCTAPVAITPEYVELGPVDGEGNPVPGESLRHETDFVLLATGFNADMSLFREAGVELSGPLEKPNYNPDTMETNVPGLYLIGTAAGGSQHSGVEHFIETSHHHVVKIVERLTGATPRIASVPGRNYELFPEEKSEEEQARPVSHR